MKSKLILLTALVMAILLATSGVIAQQGGRIEGHVVTSDGQPVPRATVQIQGGATSAGNAGRGRGVAVQPKIYIETADANGSFSVDDLDPGSYTMNAQVTGYNMPGTNSPAPNAPPTTFTIAAGETQKDLKIMMIRLGLMTGTILDADGEPVPNARIRLLRENFNQGRLRLNANSESSADDRGQFRVANIDPGRYYVMAIYQNQNGVPTGQPNVVIGRSAMETNLPTYYPGTLELRGAQRLEVGSTPIENVQVRMLRGKTFAIRGTVDGVPPAVTPSDRNSAAGRSGDGRVGRNFNLNLVPRGGNGNVPNISTQIRGNEFEIRNVPPGEYVLTARVDPLANRNVDAPNGVTPLPANPPAPNPAPQMARQEIVVGGADLNNLLLRPQAAVEITGRVRIDDDSSWSTVVPANNNNAKAKNGGNATAQGPTINLVAADEGGPPNVQIHPEPDGRFDAKDVLPGRYLINFPQPRKMYLKQVRFGGQDITHKTLEITSGGELELVASTKMASVTVTWPASLADSKANNVLVLWPVTPEASTPNGGVLNLGKPPANGSGNTASIAPGDYRVAIFSDVPSQEMLRVPDFLVRFNSEAAKLSLQEGDKLELEPKVILGTAFKKVYDDFPN